MVERKTRAKWASLKKKKTQNLPKTISNKVAWTNPTSLNGEKTETGLNIMDSSET